MSSTEETGQVTGTKDKDYNLIWFTEQCLSNALRLEAYVQDAERDGDNELADFFRRAQKDEPQRRRAGQRAAAQAACRLAKSSETGGVRPGLAPASSRPLPGCSHLYGAGSGGHRHRCAGAAALYPKTAGKGLALGDRACLALAQRLGAPAVTAERAWDKLDIDVEIQLIRSR